MALNKQVWLREIEENIYPDNSFASKSMDDSIYVSNKTVHIPNAGAPSQVVKNRPFGAATVKQRTDVDLEYHIDEYTTDPIHISNVEEVELSYDKRSSVLHNDTQELQRVTEIGILEKWAQGAGNTIRTSGAAIDAHTYDGATGKRKGVSRRDVLALSTLFNKQDIPKSERYLLLDSDMYSSLLSDLTEADKVTFFSCADAAKGVLGRLYGFDIMERSSVLRVKNDAETLLFEGEQGETNELAAGLAWHRGSVSRAKGDTKMFDETDSPIYYGDVYAFLVRAGGSHRRHDKKGIALLVETAV